MSNLSHTIIKKAILKTQHCQRNFDLSCKLPEEDIQLLKTAVSQCPSKQNIRFYGAHFVFDRGIIEKIHLATKGFGIDNENLQTNPQTLAKLLIVFEAEEPETEGKIDSLRSRELKAHIEKRLTSAQKAVLQRDRDQAVGVAAGYVNLTAGLLGYATGCCACFDKEKLKEILALKGDPLLIMGIGHKDMSRNRREHHLDRDFIFPSFEKQEIPIHFVGSQTPGKGKAS